MASSSTPNDILLDHTFPEDESAWELNGPKILEKDITSGDCVWIKNRKKEWHGLQQDIRNRVDLGKLYQVSAFVRASESATIEATLRLEFTGRSPDYSQVGKISYFGNEWKELKGEFQLKMDAMPLNVFFYIEGPPAQVDLYIQSIKIYESIPEESTVSINLNPEFEDSIKYWDGLGCNISSHKDPVSETFFVTATDRKFASDGIQQDITNKVKELTPYELSASVRISGNNAQDYKLMATLYVKKENRREYYHTIDELKPKEDDWALLCGKFTVNARPVKAVIYIHGVPAGTDIHVSSFVLKPIQKNSPSTKPDIENPGFNVNIIQDVFDTPNGWVPQGDCELGVKSGSPREIPPTARKVLGGSARTDGRYIHVSKRTESPTGPAQCITRSIKPYLTYLASAWVRIAAGTPQTVTMTLEVDGKKISMAEVELGDSNWLEVFGSFRIEEQPNELKFYIHGPARGIDLMVCGVHIFPVDPRIRFEYLKKQTDNIRKRDVTLKISGGKVECPVGSIVKVRQTQNAFPFGSCISRRCIDNKDLVKFFVKNFKWTVFGNELKWCSTEAGRGKFDYRDADDLVNFCKKNSIKTRGHCIFSEDKDHVPLWAHSLTDQELKTVIGNRVVGLLKRYKGKFKHYDVYNEMPQASFVVGEDTQAEMFTTASQLDSSAVLFVNDYHVDDGYDMNSSLQKYKLRIQALKDKKAPVGGIGVQGYIKSPVGAIVRSALDKLKDLDIPIWLTELDVSSTNEFVRADDLEIMLREAFAHPSVEGILLWGFWELNMCRENSHLVNADGDINEAGRRYLALRKEWLTRADGHLDEEGNFKFRGFQGEYTVEIVTNNKTILQKTFSVEKGILPWEVDLR